MKRYAAHREESKDRFLLVKIVFIIAIAVVLTTYFLVPLKINTESMAPNLNSGDRIVYAPFLFNTVFGLKAGNKNLKRGDLVLLTPPYDETGGPLLPLNPLVRFFTLNRVDLKKRGGNGNPYMVRRVIGLPGDKVRIQNGTALIIPPDGEYSVSEFELIGSYRVINDNSLDDLLFSDEDGREPLTLGEESYFLLADNRTEGIDSRHWGAVDRRRIAGRILFSYYRSR